MVGKRKLVLVGSSSSSGSSGRSSGSSFLDDSELNSLQELAALRMLGRNRIVQRWRTNKSTVGNISNRERVAKRMKRRLINRSIAIAKEIAKARRLSNTVIMQVPTGGRRSSQSSRSISSAETLYGDESRSRSGSRSKSGSGSSNLSDLVERASGSGDLDSVERAYIRMYGLNKFMKKRKRQAKRQRR